ncbi:unnamed protein product, partial [Mesorhabditis spiculigera]
MTSTQCWTHLQADLGDLSSLSTWNDGMKWLLLVVDVYSKFIMVAALPDKRPASVAEAMRKMFTKWIPFNLLTDKGKEFTTGAMLQLYADLKINHFTLRGSDQKAQVAEAHLKTIKYKIYRYFTHNNTRRWVDVVQQIAESLNKTRSTVTGMRPVDVNFDTKIPNQQPQIADSSKFQIGDTVVLSNRRETFQKGFRGLWGSELFVVRQIDMRVPVTYRVSDLNGKKIEGRFYDAELQRAENSDGVYKVERILDERRRKGKLEYLVKWLDYDDEFNSWVRAEDVIDLRTHPSE